MLSTLRGDAKKLEKLSRIYHKANFSLILCYINNASIWCETHVYYKDRF